VRGWPARLIRKDRPLLDLQWAYPTMGERVEPSASCASRDQRLGRR
jgi:hypothetical protein